jgi:hypothetical protein
MLGCTKRENLLKKATRIKNDNLNYLLFIIFRTISIIFFSAPSLMDKPAGPVGQDDAWGGHRTIAILVIVLSCASAVISAVALGVALSQDCPCDVNAIAKEPAAATHLANTTDPDSHHMDSAVGPLPAAAVPQSHLANLTDAVSQLASGLAEQGSLLQSQQVTLQSISGTVRELANASAESLRVFTGDVTITLETELAVSFWTSLFAHVDVFAGSVTVKGTVRASDINHVLENTKRIYGDFCMQDVYFVEDDGNVSLPNLEMVSGNMDIYNNDQLMAVDFPTLHSIGGIMKIYTNEELTAADFSALLSIGASLQIKLSTKLKFTDFSALQSVGGNLNIDDNNELRVTNFSSLQSVGGTVDIEDNNNLKVTDFSSLQSVGGYHRIAYNQELTAADFPLLRFVGGNLDIHDNQALTAADFSALQTIGGYLRTFSNLINICTASTVSNAHGHTTLRNVCEGIQSPNCFVNDKCS